MAARFPPSSCPIFFGPRSDDARAQFAAIGGTLLIFTAVLAGVGSVATDPARATTTAIDSCRTITEPGTYRLTTDLESDETCIEIRASNVVFDGGGHTITGPDTTIEHDVGDPVENGEYVIPDGVDVGVLVNGTEQELTNVTVKNVVVTEFVNGVTYAGVSGGTITDVHVVRNGLDGVSLAADDLRILDSVAAENGAYGFSFISDSDGSYLRNNVAKRNAQTGIVFVANNDDNRLVENVAHHNGNYGIGLFGGSGNTLVRNTMYANDWQDLWDTGTNDVRPNNRYTEPENSADNSHEHETYTTTTEQKATTTTTTATSSTTTVTSSRRTTTSESAAGGSTTTSTTQTTTGTTATESSTTTVSNDETTSSTTTTTESGSETTDDSESTTTTSQRQTRTTTSDGGSGDSSGSRAGSGSGGQTAEETTTEERPATTSTTASTTVKVETSQGTSTETARSSLDTETSGANVQSTVTDSPTTTGVVTSRAAGERTSSRRVATTNSEGSDSVRETTASGSQTKTITWLSDLQSTISRWMSLIGVATGAALAIRRR